MTLPHQRRRDPSMFVAGWEVAVAAIAAVALVIGLAALVAIGCAGAVMGDGWVWPHDTDTIATVLGGLLTGHPGRGLTAAQLTRLPGTTAIYACVALLEMTATALTIGAAITLWRRLRNDGMATRWEARQALGLRQLHDVKALIRPDLYGAKHTRRRTGRP